ncbi:MAG: hypothetical protein AB3N23_16110 [Paracoccaceae bacterium]
MLRHALLVALLFCVAVPVWAEEDQSLVQIRASRVMYDAGMAQRDALLVLAAAKLRRSVGLEPVDRAAEDGTPSDERLGWAEMLEDARELANGDPILTGLVEDVAAERTKGVTNGPVYNTASLGAKDSDTYRNLPFDGQKYAEIYVEAGGRQDINLFVYDAQNRLVCSDTDASAIAYCGWKPRSSGSFSVKVTNASGSGTTYSLVTN